MASHEHELPPPAEISSGEIRALVNPHGAYLEQLTLGGVDLLLPRQTVEEGTELKNRGGVFFCMPYFGPGEPLYLPWQHGFGRDVPWLATPIGADPGIARLTFDAGEQFGRYTGLHAEVSYQVTPVGKGGARLACALYCKNNGPKAMVLAPGLHPYFPNDGRKLVVSFGDGHNVGTATPYDESQLSISQVIGHGVEELALEAGGRTVAMRSSGLPVPVAWSRDLSHYVCVEPTSQGVLGTLPESNFMPDEERSFSTVIEWRPQNSR